MVGCTEPSPGPIRRDVGIVPTDGALDGGVDSGVPVDANLPRDTNSPRDANAMFDAVGGGAGLMCTACTTDADCRAGSFCVQLASTGDRVCLQNCNAEIPSCPRRFDCLNSILTPTAGPVCTPVGERCCIDSDEDDYGFGVGCRGTDCDDGNPNVYMGATESCNSIDDNCDGVADDGNPGGGNLCAGSAPGVCSAGMTMCSAGAVMCAPTVVPGARTESCNALDDDCDGPVDEGFAFMGDPLFPGMAFPLQGACAVGLGACRRAGAVSCAADHAGAVCSAVAAAPHAETCNYADDDCNGTVDDAFVNGAGVYDADTDCGACGIDCTAIYMSPGSFGTCNTSGARPTCQLNCMPGAFNLNGIPDDGCEFALDSTAIYVSGEDPAAVDNASCGLGPSASGGARYPCRTIAFGQSRATTTGRARVVVADALYIESITLVNGQSLLGGYRADTWERHLTTTLTTIRGTNGSGHRRTVSAFNITMPTTLEGFVIDGASASSPGTSSYAVYVSGGTSALVIQNNSIYAGDGAPGSSGAAGTDGLVGVNGTSGMDAFDTGTTACVISRAGPTGGARTCGGVVVSGGAGGSVACPTANDGTPHSSQPAGMGSGAGGGTPGARAFDGSYNATCNNCMLPSTGGSMSGSNGTFGANGANGAGGLGAASGAGSVAGGDWVGAAGGSGGAAGHGGGGGGGSAGGGGDGSGACTDDLGATGGSGGSGGCGGTAGGGGTAAGGSFGIFIVGTTSYPVLTNNTIYRAFGGTGGNGGRGGAGGVAGAGAAGGRASTAFASFCTGDGGTGGGGGNGGQGGGGGGGAGGVSYAIYTSGTTGYGAATNTFPASGGGGTGGGGGPSLGTPGSVGATGVSATTN